MKPSTSTGPAAPAESALPPDPGFEGKWLTIKLFALVTALPLPINDLIAARLITIALGLTAALAYYLLARDLFSPRAGVISVALYVVLPFTVIYTSLAMTDGIQVAFSAWAIFLAVRLARSSHWIYTVTLPLVLGAAILAKFSALVLIALPVMAVLLLTPRMQWVDAGTPGRASAPHPARSGCSLLSLWRAAYRPGENRSPILPPWAIRC